MRRMLAFAALALAGCGGSPHTGKTRVVLSLEPGVGLVKELNEFVDGNLTVTCDGKEERVPLFKEENRQVEDEVLESDGVRVLSVRRKVTAWDLKKRGPADAAPVAVPVSLLGKTYVVRRTEFGPVIEGAEASADELRANSLDQVEAILSLPEYPVGVGDSWPIHGERIVSVFGGDGGRGLKIREARGSARMEGAVRGNPPVALVSVRIEVEGAFRSLLDVDVYMDYRATFRIDIDKGRLVGMEASGEGKISGELDRQGKPAVYKGDFRYSARGSSRLR